MICIAGLPHVITITRFFTVAKVKDVRSSVGWSLVFIAILCTTAPAVGAMAWLNLMETIRPTSGENAGLHPPGFAAQVLLWPSAWQLLPFFQP